MKEDNPFVLGVGELLWDMLPGGKQCGGAPANVVYHLRQLGTPALLLTAVGRDALGDELLEFLTAKGISTEFITRNDLPTGTVSVTLEKGIPAYEIHHPAAWDGIVVPEGVKTRLNQVSAVIWGTLAQRSAASRKAIRDILALVPETSLKCFDINLRQHFYDREMIVASLKLANVLKINDEEVEITAKLLGLSGSLRQVIREIHRAYALRAVICTLGAKGSMLYTGTEFTEYPVKPCEVADTVGCGDSFLAAWCAAVLNGKSAEEGMEAGTGLSAWVAAHSGAMCEHPSKA